MKARANSPPASRAIPSPIVPENAPIAPENTASPNPNVFCRFQDRIPRGTIPTLNPRKASQGDRPFPGTNENKNPNPAIGRVSRWGRRKLRRSMTDKIVPNVANTVTLIQKTEAIRFPYPGNVQRCLFFGTISVRNPLPAEYSTIAPPGRHSPEIFRFPFHGSGCAGEMSQASIPPCLPVPIFCSQARPGVERTDCLIGPMRRHFTDLIE